MRWPDGYFVERSPSVNGAGLDGLVDHGGQGCLALVGDDFWVEERFGCHKVLVPDRHPPVKEQRLGRPVGLLELVGESDQGTQGVLLLDLLCDGHRLLAAHRRSVPQGLLDVSSQVSAGYGEVLDGGRDDVSVNLCQQVIYACIWRTTGMMCVSPSPESTTMPDNDWRPSRATVRHEEARARTACTAMYNPGTLNVSNMISAMDSRFSGAFKGGSVY